MCGEPLQVSDDPLAREEPCEHDTFCPGYGWEHEVELTPAARKELGLPLNQSISMKKARRAMRRHRAEIHEGALMAEIGALRATVRALRMQVAVLEKEVEQRAVE